MSRVDRLHLFMRHRMRIVCAAGGFALLVGCTIDPDADGATGAGAGTADSAVDDRFDAGFASDVRDAGAGDAAADAAPGHDVDTGAAPDDTTADAPSDAGVASDVALDVPSPDDANPDDVRDATPDASPIEDTDADDGDDAGDASDAESSDASDDDASDASDTGDDAGFDEGPGPIERIEVDRVRLAPTRTLAPLTTTRCTGVDEDTEPTRFTNVTGCVGLDTVTGLDRSVSTFLSGIAWGDIDGDDDLDLFVANSTGPNGLYRNEGNGSFVPHPDAATVALPDGRSSGASFVDFDNDGDADLYVTQDGPNVLFENRGGTFRDVTEAAGVGDDRVGAAAAWGDFDGDGDLDLYVSNWACTLCYDDRFRRQVDRLYENRGDGTFRPADDLLGDTRSAAGFAATWIDVDADGDLDLYVANDKGYPGDPRPVGSPFNRNMLYRNDGPGCGHWCFTEIGRDVGVDLRFDSMGLATGDPDHDGDPDFYISNGAPEGLLINDGSGGFDERAEAAGAVCIGQETWGVTFVDVDNDGHEDLYAGTSLGWTPALGSNRLFIGLGDGTFVDGGPHGAESSGRTTLGVARADYDHDGRVDLVLANQYAPYLLMRNTGSTADFVALRLVGGGPIPRDPAGARVDLTRTDGVVLTRWVIIGSSLGATEDRTLHFGLGDADVASVVITWPNGVTERLFTLPRNRISIVEWDDVE